MVLKVLEEVYTNYLHYFKYSYAIFEGYYLPGVSIRGKHDALSVINHRLNFQGWNDGYLILHLSPGLEVDAAARELFKSALGTQCLRCVALVARSRVERNVLEFFSEIREQVVPIKVFTDRANAMQWVLEQRFANPFSLN